MENVVFLVIIFGVMVLMYNFTKIKNKYHKKSKLLQEEIDILKMKNKALKDKKVFKVFIISDLNSIFSQVSELHKLVIKKHLK